MSQKLSAVAVAVTESCATVVASAVNSENTARDRWVRAAKALYKAGARVEALTKGTKDEPNEAEDASLIGAIQKMIVDALSASVKPMKFAGVTYTVGELLALSREALREADDTVLSQTRKYWQQQLGSYFALVRRYVDRVQNPDKPRGTKSEGKEKKEETPADGPTVWIQQLENIKAKAAAQKSWKAEDIVALQDSATTMLALIKRNKA